jgi:hypothetical protein
MGIEACHIPEHSKIEVLPRHFGRHALTVERSVYGFMLQLCRTYVGGCWRFVELSNGGFYMSPPDEMYEVRVAGNGFQARMIADAVGVTVCLFTFSQLASECETDVFARHFHWLRDFALDHQNASVILEAID